jgi:hypothetical protein
MFGASKRHTLNLEESAKLRFTPSALFALEDAEKYYQQIEDLLILLADRDYSFDWPQLTSANGKQKSQLYFLKNRGAANAPAKHECLITFPLIREQFGQLLSSWMEKQERFGPAFYLYLGTRRGVKLYVEHRFVNLIWGLEAFDRKSREVAANQALQEKICRILSQVERKRDKAWLRGKLRHAAEPSLEERLYDTFSALPLALDDDGLHAFCKECATKRNEISHYGGHTHAESYPSFVRSLDQKSDALSALYHILLLTEIGIDPSLLDFQTNRMWPANAMAAALRRVGLTQRTIPPPPKKPKKE